VRARARAVLRAGVEVGESVRRPHACRKSDPQWTRAHVRLARVSCGDCRRLCLVLEERSRRRSLEVGCLAGTLVRRGGCRMALFPPLLFPGPTARGPARGPRYLPAAGPGALG